MKHSPENKNNFSSQGSKIDFTLIARKVINDLKKDNLAYYNKIKVKYDSLSQNGEISPTKIAKIAADLFKKHNEAITKAGKKPLSMAQFFKEHFNAKPENYIKYLLTPQKYYISSVSASEDMGPFGIVGKILDIYRHAFIVLPKSPFGNGEDNNPKNSEIIELSPISQTDITKTTTEIRKQREVPGFVTMSLHCAGTRLLATGNYDLKNYRPWKNDCQTFIKHAQEEMNDILEDVGLSSAKQSELSFLRYLPKRSKKEIRQIKINLGLNPNNPLLVELPTKDHDASEEAKRIFEAMYGEEKEKKSVKQHLHYYRVHLENEEDDVTVSIGERVAFLQKEHLDKHRARFENNFLAELTDRKRHESPTKEDLRWFSAAFSGMLEQIVRAKVEKHDLQRKANKLHNIIMNTQKIEGDIISTVKKPIFGFIAKLSAGFNRICTVIKSCISKVVGSAKNSSKTCTSADLTLKKPQPKKHDTKVPQYLIGFTLQKDIEVQRRKAEKQSKASQNLASYERSGLQRSWIGG